MILALALAASLVALVASYPTSLAGLGEGGAKRSLVLHTIIEYNSTSSKSLWCPYVSSYSGPVRLGFLEANNVVRGVAVVEDWLTLYCEGNVSQLPGFTLLFVNADSYRVRNVNVTIVASSTNATLVRVSSDVPMAEIVFNGGCEEGGRVTVNLTIYVEGEASVLGSSIPVILRLKPLGCILKPS